MSLAPSGEFLLSADEAHLQDMTRAGHVEDQVAIADQLFVTGALRIDADQQTGTKNQTAAYPKAAASWLPINGGATTVRLRGAVGESSTPLPLGLQLLELSDPAVAALSGTVLGIPPVKLERTTEFEGGVDIDGWAHCATLTLTGYSKTTSDAVIPVNLGVQLGGGTIVENAGRVRNTGAEASARFALVQSRLLTWDIAVNALVNRTN